MSIVVVLWAHAVATLYMVGLIWFVQLVHYPLLRDVGTAAFPRYIARHQSSITAVVAPAMLLELATAGWLLLTPPWTSCVAAWLGGALLLVIWCSTWCLQVPCHQRLAGGYDAVLLRRLVRTNWIRTLAWTARGFVAVVLLHAVPWQAVE